MTWQVKWDEAVGSIPPEGDHGTFAAGLGELYDGCDSDSDGDPGHPCGPTGGDRGRMWDIERCGGTPGPIIGHSAFRLGL
jgi:hypothetical protein